MNEAQQNVQSAHFEFDGVWEQQVVASSIHSGHELRGEVAELMVLDEADRLREEDPFTHLIAQLVPARVLVNRSRFEVDLNRDREGAVYQRPEDCWGLVVWRGEELPDDVAERSREEHDAFYAALAERLDELAARGPFVLYDVHSYNHRRDGAEAPAQSVDENPEVNVGTGSLDREFFGDVVDSFNKALSSQSVNGHLLDVRENVRFQGAHLAKFVHERYPGTGCVLALEFKKTFMDEWTGELDHDHTAQLAHALAATVEPVQHALDRLAAGKRKGSGGRA